LTEGVNVVVHSPENILSLLPLLEEQIDRLDYDLYGLKEKEIAPVEGK